MSSRNLSQSQNGMYKLCGETDLLHNKGIPCNYTIDDIGAKPTVIKALGNEKL
jgi:hypothetical protein